MGIIIIQETFYAILINLQLYKISAATAMSVKCMYAHLLACIHMDAQVHEHVHMSSVK